MLQRHMQFLMTLVIKWESALSSHTFCLIESGRLIRRESARDHSFWGPASSEIQDHAYYLNSTVVRPRNELGHSAAYEVNNHFESNGVDDDTVSVTSLEGDKDLQDVADIISTLPGAPIDSQKEETGYLANLLPFQ